MPKINVLVFRREINSLRRTREPLKLKIRKKGSRGSKLQSCRKNDFKHFYLKKHQK